MTRATAIPVLWLDLDGTVRKSVDELGRFVNGPEDVELFPGVIKLMKAWKRGGGRIVGVSNQGGIALGHVTPEQVQAAMLRTHELTGGLFDKIAWCSHHPAAQHPEMARCWCRKPAPGLLIEAGLALTERHRDEMYPPYMALMVGDRDEDQECARIANVDFQWAAEWRAEAS
ncbi:hypothetical protein [Actinomycetospora aeridis]|uniref:D,D-heptose 1,7-bisphosphate phosphatase n=1 Tax=Actinomycetospora aeridis TaxID=3129231 RepID=A0ABU8N2E1_9PSEU